MTKGLVAGLITVAPLTLPRFVLLATFTRAVPDDTGGAAGPPWTIGGDTAPGPCSAGNGCAPGKFLGEGETTGWPIALRAVGAVIGVRPAGLRDEIPGFVVFALGLIRICCCVTPRGGSTGGATAASASIGTLALLGAGFVPLAPVPLAPFPLAPLLAVLARTACAWPSLARHGCAAKAASTMLERTSRKRISFLNADLGARLQRSGTRCGRRLLAIQEQCHQRRNDDKQHDRPNKHAADHHCRQRPLHLTADPGRDRRR